MFAFGPWLAPMFYVTYIVLVHRTSIPTLMALTIEAIFLAFYLALFSQLLSSVRDRPTLNLGRIERWLTVAFFLKVAFAIPLLSQSGYGLFSAGSRIEYLSGSSLNVYITYASYLVDAVAIPFSAIILNRRKRWSGLVIAYLFLNAALSLLAGSKGGGILELLALCSLLRLERAGDYLRLFRFPAIALATFFGFTIYYVGAFLALEPIKIVSLMFSRIFLNNDARALAIDYAGHLNQGGTSLFAESFRFWSSFIGLPPANPPLGRLLYMEAFSTHGFVGANTSSTALLIAYGGDIERLLFSLVLILAATGIFMIAGTSRRYKIIEIPTGLYLILQISQDFLAFQVAVNLILMVSFALLLYVVMRRILISASHAHGRY